MSAGPVGSGMGPARWTLLHYSVAQGAWNMARDHALALSVQPDRAVLRLYGWSGRTLSFGRNEPARDVFDPEAARALRVDLVRRPTGGRAVLHHREVTYAVVAPARAFGGLRAAYVAIHQAIARGLQGLGVSVDLASGEPGASPPSPGDGPCFDRPAPGELTSGGRKLVGSAQARIGEALLQHGSILIENDQPLVAHLSRGRTPRGVAPPATLRGLLGRAPPPEEVAGHLADGFRAVMGRAWVDGPEVTDVGNETLPAELIARYRSKEWTWRR